MEGAAVVAAEEEGLGLHVDVGGVGGEGGNFVGEEDGGGVEVLAHAVTHYAAEFLDLFLPHFLQHSHYLRIQSLLGFCFSLLALGCRGQIEILDGGKVFYMPYSK